MASSAVRSRTASRLALAALVLGAVWLTLHFDLASWLTLERLQASREALAAVYRERPLATLLGFFGLYVAATALSVPGAVVLTLAAGAMFGFWVGLLLVSFASSLGALLAFWVARHLLRDTVRARFGARLGPIEDGVRRDGTAYLLTLRLVPLFPFWLVNLLMGLTPMGAARFYAVSQLGMLAGTAVYVNAGTQLATLHSAADVFSPALLGSFILLGFFPVLARSAVEAWRRRQTQAPWRHLRPRRFDRNLVVIGAGSGGLVSAYMAAALKARVTLVEAQRMGGDCLNTGCVPSKALIRAARAAAQVRQATTFGVQSGEPTVDFPAVMAWVRGVIARIEPHDSVERYTALGVEVLQGHAKLTSPWSVEVQRPDGSTQVLTTRHVVIATGARPAVPPLPGLNEKTCLTSDTVWNLQALPRRLAVMGGGPVGCELAQAFARLGAEVTLVQRAERLLPREDAQAAELVAQALRADGVRLLLGHEAVRVEALEAERRLITRHAAAEVGVPFDELLCAVGRMPRVTGFGLEELGIPLTPQGTVQTDAFLRTRHPNIFAVGDVAGPLQLTHAAAHQAWHAVVNALFGRFWRFKVDLRFMPSAVFTDPEVARVGLTESQAREQGLTFEVTHFPLDDLDRAIAEGAARGFVKVLTQSGRDRILGVTVVGEHAGELIAPWALAMRHGLGLNRVLATTLPYPTMAESAKLAAGQWKRAHAPQRLLRWAQRYHDWNLK